MRPWKKLKFKQKHEMHSITFEAIGTSWQIDLHKKLSQEKLSELTFKIHKRISEFDKTYSRFKKDSWVSKISKKTGEYPLPPDATPLFLTYEKFYKLSDGLFTPLVGNLLEDAGYDAKYSLVPGRLTRPPRIEDSYALTNNSIKIKKAQILDFGAGGKGYLIDILGELITKEGVTSFVIDAGGDILHKGKKSISVGLENPLNLKQVLGKVEVLNKSICGSSGNRRNWGKYHHIINPKTLTSPQDVLAVWVIADSTFLADIISTYLFLSSDTIKLMEFSFDYAILHEDYSVSFSEGFKDSFFT